MEGYHKKKDGKAGERERVGERGGKRWWGRGASNGGGGDK